MHRCSLTFRHAISHDQYAFFGRWRSDRKIAFAEAKPVQPVDVFPAVWRTLEQDLVIYETTLHKRLKPWISFSQQLISDPVESSRFRDRKDDPKCQLLEKV